MQEVLRAESISKSFPACWRWTMSASSCDRGEILGAGRRKRRWQEHLTQILGGAQRPDSGRILLEDKPVAFSSSADAIAAGISMVFQELSLVGSLSVAENIFANRQPIGRLNNIHWTALLPRSSRVS